MKLIETILRDVTDSNIPLSDILSKCKILANILKNKDLETWIDNELNGYDSELDLPDYRILNIDAKGNFRNIAYNLTSLIAPVSLDKEYKLWAEKAYIRESISSIEDISKSGESIVRIQWPPDLIALLQRKEIVQNFTIMDAWQEITRGQLLRILSTVRTKILDFILDLKSNIPELESFDFTSSSNNTQQEIASQVISNNFENVTGNVAVGSKEFKQEVIINKFDFDALKTELLKLGIPENNIDELKKAIEEDGEIAKKNTLGKNVSIWIGKILAMGGQLFKDIGLSVASKLIIELIQNYYGF